MRLGGSILWKMRHLLVFLLIALFALGFNFYILTSDSYQTPSEGIAFMFLVMLGNYDVAAFNNGYLITLFVLAVFINICFFMTLIISIAVNALKSDSGVDSN